MEIWNEEKENLLDEMDSIQKINVFRKIQTNLSILGITADQSTQNHPFNAKISMGIFIFSYSIISHILYILYDAKGFDKYIECICSTSARILITTCFGAMVFKMATLFKLIGRKEDLIATSECI